MCLASSLGLSLILCYPLFPTVIAADACVCVLSLIMTLRLTLSFRTLFAYFVVAESRDTFFFCYIALFFIAFGYGM